jgi:MFS family permease
MRRTPRNVWLLGFVSLLNDLAAESTLRLLPFFIIQILGASTAVVGLIEGVADSTATLTRLVSGWLSDRMARRKPLVVAGYAIGSAAKPLLLLANHWSFVLFVRFTDRLGKGIRSAPRDALLAAEAHADARGHSFGIARALDTLGAFAGLLLAYAILKFYGGGVFTLGVFRAIVWVSLIPAAAAVTVIAFVVKETALPKPTSAEGAGTLPTSHPRLPKAYWRYIAVVALFTLSNSSDAFLVLRAAGSLGPGAARAAPDVSFAIMCLLALNFSSVFIAAPAGRLSDKLGRKRLIMAGWLVYAASYAAFGLFPPGNHALDLALFLFYGSFYGLSEGAERALIADLVPAEKRGTAYGVFNFTVGVFAFPASFAFGIALARFGPGPSFVATGGVAAAAAAALAFLIRL